MKLVLVTSENKKKLTESSEKQYKYFMNLNSKLLVNAEENYITQRDGCDN